MALGLVMAAAQGATPLAFAIAGIVYIFVGLAYTEMAPAYPVAGSGQYFTLRKVLQEAGIGDADVFLAVTNGDNTNIMASQIAKVKFGVPSVTVCSVRNWEMQSFTVMLAKSGRWFGLGWNERIWSSL
ncbi:MAG: NAD-binding protein [Armatimonadota bacterium]